jgi:membrane associated rhomboid family serine protease
MGIYDREYYRREGPSFLGSGSSACTWILVATVLCFLGQLLIPEITAALLLVPAYVMEGQVWRLVSYAFLHDPSKLFHIVANMWVFWIFGHQIEPVYGKREFVAFYLISALAGGLTFTAAWALGFQAGACLGASGAVTAVLVLCALHFPRQTVLLFFVMPVPLWLLAIGYVALDALVFVGGNQTPTAVVVHLGGALFAFAYYQGHWRISRWWPDLKSWQIRLRRPRLRIYRESPASSPLVGVRSGADSDEHLEAKLDRVLAKVAEHGQGSLNETERSILLQASEIYKRRRT